MLRGREADLIQKIISFEEKMKRIYLSSRNLVLIKAEPGLILRTIVKL